MAIQACVILAGVSDVTIHFFTAKMMAISGGAVKEIYASQKTWAKDPLAWSQTGQRLSLVRKLNDTFPKLRIRAALLKSRRVALAGVSALMQTLDADDLDTSLIGFSFDEKETLVEKIKELKEFLEQGASLFQKLQNVFIVGDRPREETWEAMNQRFEDAKEKLDQNQASHMEALFLRFTQDNWQAQTLISELQNGFNADRALVKQRWTSSINEVEEENAWYLSSQMWDVSEIHI